MDILATRTEVIVSRISDGDAYTNGLSSCRKLTLGMLAAMLGEEEVFPDAERTMQLQKMRTRSMPSTLVHS